MAIGIKDKLLQSFERAKQNVGFVANNFGPAIQRNIQRPVQQFMARPVPQVLQPMARGLERVQQNPLLQFGSGLIQGQNLSLGRSPIAPPTTPAGKFAYGVGSFGGAMNPQGLTQRVIKPVIGFTNPIINKAIGPVANKAITGRVAAGVGNVAQGLVLDKAMLRPTTPQSVAFDAFTGAAIGPNQFGKTIAKGMNPRRSPKIIMQESDVDDLLNINRYLNREKVTVDDMKTIMPDIEAIFNRLKPQLPKGIKYNSFDQQLKVLLPIALENQRFRSSAISNISMGIKGQEPPKGVGEITPPNLKTKSPLKLKPTTEPVPVQSSIKSQTQPANISSEPIIAPMKERGFVTTVKESKSTAKDVANKIQGYYTQRSTPQLIKRAQDTVAQNYDVSKQRVFNEPLTDETNAIGQELMRQSQNAGRFDEATEIAEELARKGTQAGQTVQAFSIWSRLTPEGMVRYAQQQMIKATKNMGVVTKAMRKITNQKDVKLTPEDTKIITGIMKKANATTDETARAGYIKEAFEYIGKKLPWGVSDALDEYRYNNMLSNPLTHLRNVYSNLVQTYITRPATLVAQGKAGEAAKYELGAIKALPEAFDNMWKTIKGNKPLGRLDEVVNEGIKKPPRLGILGTPSKLLEAGDQFFTTLIKSGEKARGATDATAESMAQYSLFRQDLKPAQQGYLLNKIDDVTKAVYQLRRVGLGWFIPFIRTPMNVAKQMLEYSPAGVLTAAGAGNKREQLSKAFLGSLATAYGAKMALEGRTTWAAPTDPKQKELFYASGKKPYSIKIGDKWVPMQYLGVYQWAAGLPAAYKYYNEESPKALTDDQLTKLTKTSASILQQFSQQTFVSGLASFVNMAQGDVDYNFKRNVAFALGQLNPMGGMQRYIATAIDPVFRKATTFTDQLKSGVPGMTQGLKPYTSPDGTPQTRNITNFIAPYGMGIDNPKYNQPLQERTQQLQQNAVKNQLKKQAEETGSNQVSGNTVILKDGTEIDLAFEPKEPQYTGQVELDKKLKSQYNSQVTKKINNIVDLFQAGYITAEEAEQMIAKYKPASTTTSTKKTTKKAKKTISDAQLISAYKKAVEAFNKPTKIKRTTIMSEFKPIKLKRAKIKSLRSG